MDNFEWGSGFAPRFGIHYTDYATGARVPKRSAEWYSRVMQTNEI
jgi:beta-glucosidase